MPKHYSKETSNHVKLLYDMLMKQEQALDKHDGKLLFYETTLKDQEKRIDDLEKIAHSQLIWRIEDYSRSLPIELPWVPEELFIEKKRARPLIDRFTLFLSIKRFLWNSG